MVISKITWILGQPLVGTLPTAEILGGKNMRAFMVCGFLMKKKKKKYPENMKKIVEAEWNLPATYIQGISEQSVKSNSALERI